MAHSSWSDRDDIPITNLIIIIKSEIATFPIAIIFPWLCAWGRDTSYAVGSIYVPEKLVFQFFLMTV